MTKLSTLASLRGFVADAKVTVYEYLASAEQTTFTGTDENSATLAYTPGDIIVTLNGVTLRPGDDYTASNGSSVILASGAAENDEVVITTFTKFTVADAYTITETNTALDLKADLTDLNLKANIADLGALATVDNITTANVTNIGTIATQDSDDVTISGGNVYGTGLKVATVSSSSNVTTLDYTTGSVFKSTATENTTITPTNMPAQEGIMLLKLTNGGAYTISYAGNCAFIANTAPTLTASGTDYLFIQGNATHYAVFTQLDVY